MRTVVFLLEEPSARDLLEGLLPKLLPDGVCTRYLVFEGKQDLERRMTRTLRHWLLSECLFVVLRDQDSGDCKAIKRALAASAQQAGKPETLIRIACRELESWVLGDLESLARAYEAPSVLRRRNAQLYRDPDRLGSPVTELRKLVPTYQKRDGARRVGPLLDPSRSTSTSFRAFCAGLQRMVRA